MSTSDGKDICWLTAIYASNQTEERKKLWDDISGMAGSCANEWCLIGDFNNVLSVEDRIGCAPVQIQEFQDLRTMMENVGLFECQMRGTHFTWSNRNKED